MCTCSCRYFPLSFLPLITQTHVTSLILSPFFPLPPSLPSSPCQSALHAHCPSPSTLFSPTACDSISLLLLHTIWLLPSPPLYLISFSLFTFSIPPLIQLCLSSSLFLLSIPIAWLRSCMLTDHPSSSVHPHCKWQHTWRGGGERKGKKGQVGEWKGGAGVFTGHICISRERNFTFKKMRMHDW